VSVVMAVYNGERFLASAIASVLAQTYHDFELVVVDDGSTDGSNDVIASFQDDRIKVVAQSNQGLAAALNAGLQIARGTFIARHDADDVSEPDRLELQLLYLEKHPDVALLGTNYHCIDGEDRVFWTTDVFTEPDDLKLAEIASNQFGHGAVMIRASALEEAGMYDGQYASACDVDLWTRLSRRSRIANLKEPLYRWRNVGQGLSTSDDGQLRTADEVSSIRRREFAYFLEHRRDFKPLAFNPRSTRGGSKEYLRMKNTMFRDLALLASYAGRRRLAFQFLVLALVSAPWIKRTHRQLLVTLFRPRLIADFPYDYI
jgi:glycosyltransferase involved in cell wall biosynthesis